MKNCPNKSVFLKGSAHVLLLWLIERLREGVDDESLTYGEPTFPRSRMLPLRYIKDVLTKMVHDRFLCPVMGHH